MKAKKILFVGGPSDGYRKDDPWNSNQHVLRTYVRNPDWDIATYQDFGTDFVINTHTYYRKVFMDSDGTQYEAFFHDSIKNPMEALIKGYRYHRNKREKRPKKYWNRPFGQPYP